MAYPVYKEIAEILNNNPDMARQMQLEQLHPIIVLSLQSPNALLDSHTLKAVYKIYEQRASVEDFTRPIPNIKLTSKSELPKVRIKKPVLLDPPKLPPVLLDPPKLTPVLLDPPKLPEPAFLPKKIIIKTPIKMTLIKKPPLVLKAKPSKTNESLVIDLNQDYRKADVMTQIQLENILHTADKKYYTATDDTGTVLEDKVYDYIKRIYNQRRLLTNDKEKTLLSISSITGVGVDSKPVKGRDFTLPFILLSLDNLYMGEGDVVAWSSKKKGPYLVSAKIDGNSALYYNNVLYTRGNSTNGRNISHILQYLNLPKFPHAVRGEIVMDKNLFNSKYKGKAGASTGSRKTVRNTVSGAIGAISHIDNELLRDLQFVAYEIITTEKEQLKPSEQYYILDKAGFTVANYTMMQNITDETLSLHHHQLLKTYSYEIDGLVMISDYPYLRAIDKNPDYAKAFKEALATDIAVATVINIEWNVSQYGYLIPTVVYTTVQIAGVEMSRATAHNAKNVINLGLGPGAEIEVIYWAKVNPRINQVLKAVTPSMPDVAWKWIPNGGDPVNIMFDETDNKDDSALDMKRDINVKKIHKFLTTIDAKGIGEITVGKIYDTGKTTVGDFINMTLDEIMFLGDKLPHNIIDSIKKAMSKITVPVLMASSKIFGRGIGVRKLTKVFRSNLQFISERLTHDEYIKAFLKIDGYALKTATLTADGMDTFWKFIDDEIPSEVYEQVVRNTIIEFETTEESLDEHHPDINGKKFCLTGFRDLQIQEFIEKNGGKIQTDYNNSTDMVIRATDSYINSKTSKAEAKGTLLLSQATFKQTYM